MGLGQGALGCSQCRYDVSHCIEQPVCGNGVKEPGEECDGADLDNQSCHGLDDQFVGGQLACGQDCRFDLNDCQAESHRGNGITEAGEECDGNDVGGHTCTSEGYLAGQLACSQDCRFDVSGCTNTGCGDGICDQDGNESIVSCPQDCGSLAVAAGTYHTCVILRTGTVWCWGHNGLSELGNRTTIDSLVPVQVQDITQVTVIAVGTGHTCVVRHDSTMWCWGYNAVRQHGDGTTTDRHVPVQVADMTQVTTIAAGSFHTCAIRQDGTLWCWGSNIDGQIGNGTTTDSSVPVQIQW